MGEHVDFTVELTPRTICQKWPRFGAISVYSSIVYNMIMKKLVLRPGEEQA
jgi:hypothetical protein